MKINLFDIEINISRKKTNPDFTQTDINKINDEYVQSMILKGESYYIKKSNEISLNTSINGTEAIQRLNTDGIFIIPNFVESDFVDELRILIEEYSNIYLSKLDDRQYFEDESALIQTGQAKVKSYASLAEYPKAVFDVRSGSDEGMIDVFNINKLLERTRGEQIIDQITNNPFLIDLLNSLPTPLVIRNINSYLNSGITSTRGFHVDAYKEQIKVFIYLTDVLELNNGPYTYVKGSHRKSHYRRINQYLSKEQKIKTETPIVSFDQIYPVLAPKGSLVISDQSGSHRGFPQSNTGMRRVLTLNCVPR